MQGPEQGESTNLWRASDCQSIPFAAFLVDPAVARLPLDFSSYMLEQRNGMNQPFMTMEEEIDKIKANAKKNGNDFEELEKRWKDSLRRHCANPFASWAFRNLGEGGYYTLLVSLCYLA